MRILPVAIAAFLVASGAFAQQAAQKGTGLPTLGQDKGKLVPKGLSSGSAPAAEASMGDLVSRGYEIKAAVPNGGKFIVFMQKDQSAYACEFSSLTGTRCGSIN
ncbi:hypothetical protein DTW90_16100 [Neorhizobium sp. P12A]|jgi:hypothetical protein|uniref:hypothetical protein n=1 Tax=Rhizobium/Agrobacterium group TaxID=227290 RepID=UPI0010499525|nr:MULTISPECIES: hypothetical protein [Rhizobium/Agrobacterium group]KAA0698366.1 hypothetical protein DTW90_16100 [Neorhizobium sp. P12A]TCR92851.1 hypothetical protein EV561_101292 [Rhizobium sp. BK376]